MKKIVLVSVAFAATITINASQAADIAVKASPTLVAPNWSGFYVGGDIGAAFQHRSGALNFFQNESGTHIDDLISRSQGGSSLIGGAYTGFNWQFAPSWVAGIEGDWQWLHSGHSFCHQIQRSSDSCSESNTNRGFEAVSDETHWIATVRGRLGWTFDRTMIYGTGGAAFADVRTSLAVSCLNDGCGDSGSKNATSAQSSTHKTGWVAGAGIEWLLTQNWMIRAEYLHTDLGNASNTLFLAVGNCDGGPCGVSWSRDIHYDVVRVGVGYKFGGF
jgi:outer membrane immunogenic protein